MAVSTGAIIGGAAVNSAAHALTNGGTSSGGSVSKSSSASRTFGTEASLRAQAAANTANNAANAAWEKAAEYNAEQARIQREWAERMANTTYQRTVKDMIKAGINPILAANMGLSADAVSSGATASMGNPMSYMANTYADSMSASQSHGSSWNESMSGLAYLADAIKGVIDNMSSAQNIQIAINGLDDLVNGANKIKNGDYTTEDAKEGFKNTWDYMTSKEGYTDQLKGLINPGYTIYNTSKLAYNLLGNLIKGKHD